MPQLCLRTSTASGRGPATSHHQYARRPAWYLNAVADPRVSVEVRGEVTPSVARVLSAEEVAELWPFLVQAYRGFARYRARTGRDIPVIELVPAD